MRLVDGSDLGSLLRAEGALEPARAIAICAQIAAALDAAHERGLVHRDVKPSNVLLDGSEHVYLADFGLTRRLGEEEGEAGESFAIGTPAYLAPEQLDDSPVDGSADTYALGCVLYECLTGEPVFPRTSRLALAWAHLEEEPPRPSKQRAELPQAIDSVIAEALAKEPADRYPSCGSLIDAAGAALGLGTHRASRRRRTLLLAGAAVLAIVAAAVIAAILANGAGKSAPPRLYVKKSGNKLARIDPGTRKVEAVIGVSLNPKVSAGSGRHVWVYGEGSGRITEVDARTNRVIWNPLVGVAPPAYCCGLYTGPVLAADASGAWFVHGGFVGKPQLVHLPVGRRAIHAYPLRITPTGVAVGAGAVWVVGFEPHGDAVLRVDPADGRVTATRRLPASAHIDSIAFGYGWVWAESSAKATLYRLDPHSPRLRVKKLVVTTGARATRPEMILGHVLVRVAAHNGEVFQIDPSRLKWLRSTYEGPPSGQENVLGLGARWWYDSPTGTVMRQAEENGPKQTIHVTRVLPSQGGPCLTSITTAGGSVWVTAAPMVQVGNNFLCGR